MNLQEIKKQLPIGGIKAIAEKVKLSPPTISQVFSGKVKSSKQNEILQITAEIIAEHKQKERQAMEALQKAMQA